MFKFKFMGVMALVLLGVGVGILFAQAETSTPEPVIDCAPEALSAEIVALSAQLDGFAKQYADANPEALTAVYMVGVRYQELALTCGYIPANIGEMLIQTNDIERVLPVLETLSPDSLNGQLLYNGGTPAKSGDLIGCAGCHTDGINAPKTDGTWTRWDEHHRLEPAYADKPFAYYITESILRPSDYTVAGFTPNLMPNVYHLQLGYQDLADLIAYLESQDQLLEK